MAPWQVAVGLSIVLLVPLGAVVIYDLSYLYRLTWPLPRPQRVACGADRVSSACRLLA